MWKALLAAVFGTLVTLGCDQESVDGPTTTRTTDPDPVERGTPADPPPGNPLARDAQSHPDREFLQKAAEANLAEIEAGRLAAEKAENADVRQFARHMIEEHTQAQRKLQDLAHPQNIDLPREPGAGHRQEMERLRDLSGADFDKAFMGLMVEDHQKAVALFEDYAKRATDEPVKAYAENTLPALKEHLQQARDLHTKVGGKTAD